MQEIHFSLPMVYFIYVFLFNFVLNVWFLMTWETAGALTEHPECLKTKEINVKKKKVSNKGLN